MLELLWEAPFISDVAGVLQAGSLWALNTVCGALPAKRQHAGAESGRWEDAVRSKQVDGEIAREQLHGKAAPFSSKLQTGKRKESKAASCLGGGFFKA